MKDIWRDYDKWRTASPYDNESDEICAKCGYDPCECKYIKADHEIDQAKDRRDDE